MRHVNLKFKVGSRLAVVGMNGSGKTTFINLLCRLYDPIEGQILLNGIDIRKYRYDEYMRIFAVVFQDFRLFALPLGQNVAAGAHYGSERVMDCLSKANFGDRLKTLPDGLDTPLYKELDKNGVEVSGGEAQKIDIAGDKTAVYISPGCRRASSATTSPCSTMARSSGMVRTTSSWPTKTASTTSCGMRRRSITSRSRRRGWRMHCRASAWAAARRCRPCRKAGKYGRPRPVRAAAGRSGRRARRRR